MANCYGTEQHAKFRQEQLGLGKDGEWKLEEERKKRKLQGLRIKIRYLFVFA